MGTQTHKKACQSTHAHIESTDDRHTWMLMGVCWAAVQRLAVMSLMNFQLSGALHDSITHDSIKRFDKHGYCTTGSCQIIFCSSGQDELRGL
jgi:hypothetical protein